MTAAKADKIMMGRETRPALSTIVDEDNAHLPHGRKLR
jgi:hypothetical protein